MTSEQMFDEINAYVQHIDFAINCLDAYQDLLQQAEINGDLIDLSANFFTITRFALSKCLMIEFSKLFCGSGEEKTILKLKNNVMANGNLFGKDLHNICDEFCSSYEASKPIINKLRIRRDKDLVHNDPSYFRGNINPTDNNYISPEDFQQIYSLCLTFCLRLYKSLKYEKKSHLELYVVNDLKNLMNFARNNHNES